MEAWNEEPLVALAAEQEVHRAVAHVLILVGGDVLGEQIDVHLAGALLPSALRSRLLAVRVLCLLLQFIQFIVQSVHSEIHAQDTIRIPFGCDGLYCTTMASWSNKIHEQW